MISINKPTIIYLKPTMYKCPEWGRMKPISTKLKKKKSLSLTAIIE